MSMSTLYTPTESIYISEENRDVDRRMLYVFVHHPQFLLKKIKIINILFDMFVTMIG